MFGGPLSAGILPRVRAVLAGAAASAGATTFAQAQQETQAFANHYDHGFAFDAARLLARWDHCSGATKQCELGRERARALLASGGRRGAEQAMP
jgi:hypothetical protein